MRIFLIATALFMGSYACCLAQGLQLSALKKADDIFVHTSYKLFGTQTVPSNGLLVKTSKGMVLIDTPWDEAQTQWEIPLMPTVPNGQKVSEK